MGLSGDEDSHDEINGNNRLESVTPKSLAPKGNAKKEPIVKGAIASTGKAKIISNNAQMSENQKLNKSLHAESLSAKQQKSSRATKNTGSTKSKIGAKDQNKSYSKKQPSEKPLSINASGPDRNHRGSTSTDELPQIEDYRSRLRKRPANRLQYNSSSQDYYYYDQFTRPNKRTRTKTSQSSSKAVNDKIVESNITSTFLTSILIAPETDDSVASVTISRSSLESRSSPVTSSRSFVSKQVSETDIVSDQSDNSLQQNSSDILANNNIQQILDDEINVLEIEENKINEMSDDELECLVSSRLEQSLEPDCNDIRDDLNLRELSNQDASPPKSHKLTYVNSQNNLSISGKSLLSLSPPKFTDQKSTDDSNSRSNISINSFISNSSSEFQNSRTTSNHDSRLEYSETNNSRSNSPFLGNSIGFGDDKRQTRLSNRVSNFGIGHEDDAKKHLLGRDQDFSDLNQDDHYKESRLQTAVQIFIPFIIAGLGTVGAGMVLDHVQHLDVFKSVSEIYILLPGLLGLKGNLEMTLASRLSTQAHLGKMRTKHDRFLLAKGNIALTQCQATVVSLLACGMAILIQLVSNGGIFNIQHSLLITASALLTSAIASLFLGIIMILVVFIAHSYSVNPDNIASPIAASLGDLLTLTLYAFLTNFFFSRIEQQSVASFEPMCYATIIGFLILIPFWIWIARTNPYTCDILYNGWYPIISAMMIGNASGWILNRAVARYIGIAVFHPVICGVGGNLVAVQASRLSTYLHKTAQLGQLPDDGQRMTLNPLPIIFGQNRNSATLRLLLALAIPGHLLYIAIISASESGHMKITPFFIFVYMLAAELQILCLLYLAFVLSYSMWLRHVNPDNSSIPYLTAFGDLFGIMFLMGAFMIMHTLQGAEFDKSMSVDGGLDITDSLKLSNVQEISY